MSKEAKADSSHLDLDLSNPKVAEAIRHYMLRAERMVDSIKFEINSCRDDLTSLKKAVEDNYCFRNDDWNTNHNDLKSLGETLTRMGNKAIYLALLLQGRE